MSDRRAALLEDLAAHRAADGAESNDLRRVLEFLGTREDHFSRHNPGRHITASAVVCSPRRDRVLLMHHRKLDMWLQFGGHVEPGDATVPAAALREVREESGLVDVALVAHPAPLDVDIHAIPAHRGEPAHEHYDVRYLAVAEPDDALSAQAGEVRELRWFETAEALEMDLDTGLVRALGKVTAGR